MDVPFGESVRGKHTCRWFSIFITDSNGKPNVTNKGRYQQYCLYSCLYGQLVVNSEVTTNRRLEIRLLRKVQILNCLPYRVL